MHLKLVLFLIAVLSVAIVIPSVRAEPESITVQELNVPTPLKQIQDGINPSDVTCTEGHELIMKSSNGQPACVKPSSVEKIIERGWAVHVLPDSDEQTPARDMVTLKGEVWADNWFALYLDQDLIIEDSVSINTERSFNSETFPVL